MLSESSKNAFAKCFHQVVTHEGQNLSLSGILWNSVYSGDCEFSGVLYVFYGKHTDRTVNIAYWDGDVAAWNTLPRKQNLSSIS